MSSIVGERCKPMPRPGDRYRHYKGGLYKIISIAEHTEFAGEILVVYEGKSGVWCRPISMFNKKVLIPAEGSQPEVLVDRFSKVVDLYTMECYNTLIENFD